MRISAKADYAIRALVEVAADRTRPHSCEQIAASQQIPYRFLKAVLRDLRRAGLVRSQRGAEGGYWLGREPHDISLADVMSTVDGSLLSVNGQPPEALRYPPPAQRIAHVWRAISERTGAILVGVTIADLIVDRPRRPAANLLRSSHG